MPEKHTLRDLDLGGIEVMVDRLRKLRPEKVDALAKSIRMQGLLQPIIVRPKNGTGYLLVVGHHRLEAIRNLHREGHWPSGAIRAEIVDEMDDDAALLAEIDENLIRADLSPAETAIHIARRKELYERLHPETKAGVAGGKASGRKRANKSQNESRSGFVKDTAKKTGKGRSTIAK